MKNPIELLPFGKVAAFAIELVAAPIKGKLDDWATRREFDEAVRHACRAFDARHPELVDTFFGETFIRWGIAPILAEFLTSRGQLPTAAHVASMWAETYQRADEIEQMAPYAEEFMEELIRQIAAQKRLQSLLDAAARDRAASLLKDIEQNTAKLADADRRRDIEFCFDGLTGAAMNYEDAARRIVNGGEADDLLLEARINHENGRRRLERMEYVAADSILGDFDDYLLRPFDSVLEAFRRERDASTELALLSAGVHEFKQRLRVAP